MNSDLLRCNGRPGYLQRVLFMLLIPLAQGMYFFINLTTTRAHDITTFVDRLIPFNEWFIIPYVFWYVYTFGTLLALAYADYKTYYRLLFSILTGMAVCFVIYFFYPTTVPRPHVPGTNGLQRLVLDIYSDDRPYNCFPSIHMLDTILITLFLFRHKKGAPLKVTTGIICVLIYMSTLFIKQHSVLDALASTALGIILFWVFENERVMRKLSELQRLLPQKRKTYLDGDT